VLVGYFFKVKVRPATRAQWLCCAVLRWRFAVFFLFYGIFSYFPVSEPKLIFRCDASIRSANVFFFSLQLFSHLLPSFVDLS
jgi:hypothetical protein